MCRTRERENVWGWNASSNYLHILIFSNLPCVSPILMRRDQKWFERFFLHEFWWNNREENHRREIMMTAHSIRSQRIFIKKSEINLTNSYNQIFKYQPDHNITGPESTLSLISTTAERNKTHTRGAISSRRVSKEKKCARKRAFVSIDQNGYSILWGNFFSAVILHD